MIMLNHIETSKAELFLSEGLKDYISTCFNNIEKKVLGNLSLCWNLFYELKSLFCFSQMLIAIGPITDDPNDPFFDLIERSKTEVFGHDTCAWLLLHDF